MEQTVSNLSTDGSAFETFLAVIAAGGTGVSLVTLLLTLLFRRWDSRTRLKITYEIGHPASSLARETGMQIPETPLFVVRVLNKGKPSVFLSGAYLELDGREVEVFEPDSVRWGELSPGIPAAPYWQRMSTLGQKLVNEGYRGTVRANIVIRDGTGRRHKKRVVIWNVQAWAERREPPPIARGGGCSGDKCVCSSGSSSTFW